MKRYALKGINDEQHECAVCGKVELKRVMWLVALDADGNQDGDAFHCGTTCGARLLGYTQSKVTTKIKNYKDEVDRKRRSLFYSHPSEILACEKLRELNRISERIAMQTGKHMTWQERKNHPLFIEIERLSAEAKVWADAQEILIEM